MLDAKAREALSGLYRILGTSLARLGLTPNAVTMLGVAMTGVSAALVVRQRFFVAGFVLIAGGILDFADGAVAKATGRSTLFGAFLDSIADRVSDLVILSALAWALLQRGDELAAALAIVALGLAQLTSYIRAKAESLGLDCSVGIVERAERVIVIIAALILGFVEIALGLLVAVSAVTVAQRLVHVGRQARGRA